MYSEFLKAHRELVTACGHRVDSKGEGLIVNDEGAPYNGLMTPRKRVLAALNYREPDRVPVDLSGYRSCGVAVRAYRVEGDRLQPGGVDLMPFLRDGRIVWTPPTPGEWEVCIFVAERQPNTLNPLLAGVGEIVVRDFYQRFQEATPTGSHEGLNYFFNDELHVGAGTHVWTSVTVAEDTQARMVASVRREGEKPHALQILTPNAVFLNGTRIEDLNHTVSLRAGSNPLLVHYDHAGRGYFVVKQDDPGVTTSQRAPLAMTWYDDPAVFPEPIRLECARGVTTLGDHQAEK